MKEYEKHRNNSISHSNNKKIEMNKDDNLYLIQSVAEHDRATHSCTTRCKESEVAPVTQQEPLDQSRDWVSSGLMAGIV